MGGPGEWVRLRWLLSATDEELLDALGAWYIPRREPRYVRRNALVVLGNLAPPMPSELVDCLRRWLGSEDPMLVEHAVWAARRHGREDLVEGSAVAESAHPGDD